MQRFHRRSTGLTLTELLVALALVGTVALACANLELGARQFFLLDRRRSTLLNEGQAALEHIEQTVRDSSNPQLGIGTLVVRRRYDLARRTSSDPLLAVDVSYRLANGQLIYNNGASDEVLARYVDGPNSSFAVSGRTVTTTIVTTTQGQTATVQSAASARFLP